MNRLARPGFSKPQLAAFVLVFAAIGGFVLLQGKAAGGTANIFVSANGSDSGANCKRFATAQTNPDPGGTTLCGTFNKALSLAQRGDSVEVENGTYASQHITSVPAGSGGVVTFAPAQGASVTIGNGGSNSCAGANTTFYTLCIEGGSYVEFDDMTIPSANAIRVINTDPGTNGSTYVTFKNMTAGTWRLEGQVANVSFIGGSYGNVTDSQPQIKKYNGNGDPDTSRPYNTVIDGVTFHDFHRSNTSVHTECLQLIASNKTLIRNSTFYNCDGTGDLGITDGPHDDLTIQNNFIGGGGDTGYGAQITMSTRNLVFQYNSSSQAIFFSDTATGFGPYTFRGNYIPSNPSFCNNQATYSHNLINGSSTCSSAPGGSTNTSVSSLDFVDSANHNLHLKAGANAINQGDPASCPTTDIDGDNRPQGGVCDAGADEYVGAPTANLWVDISGGSCTRQATAGIYNDAQACVSIQAAVAASQPGDQVIIKAGSYGSQNITSSSSSPGVIITGEQSSGSNAVTLSGLKPTGSWLTITNVNVSGGLDIENTPVGTPNNITFNNIDWAGNWWLSNCCSNIQQNGGRIHNYSAASDPAAIMFQSTSASTPMSNVTLNGVEIDHMTHTVAGSHFEAVRTQGWVSNLTIKNSYFHDNGVNSSQIFISSFTGGTAQTPGPIVIEGNYFDVPVSGAGDSPAFYNINGNMQGLACPDLTVRYNTNKSSMISPIGDSNGISCAAGSYTNVKISSNIAPRSAGSCTYYVYDHNLWINSSSSNCGTGDQTAASTAAAGLTGDGFHLASSSPAISAGDPSYCPSKDRDGDSRPQGAACDAGADEFITGSSITGDLNSDSHVNITDLSILLSHYGQSGTASQGDCNSDGTVTITDLSILLSHYGS